jgi:hypothetical protein
LTSKGVVRSDTDVVAVALEKSYFPTFAKKKKKRKSYFPSIDLTVVMDALGLRACLGVGVTQP